MVSLHRARCKVSPLLITAIIFHFVILATSFQCTARNSFLSRATLAPLSLRLPSLAVSTSDSSVSSSSSSPSPPSPPSASMKDEKASSKAKITTEPTTLLDRALRSDSTAAQILLDTIEHLRTPTSTSTTAVTNTTDESLVTVESFLNDLISHTEGPNSLPWWTRLRILNRFSRRARLATLSRVLSLSTPPPPSENDGAERDDARNRRRALVLVLRSLASTTTTGTKTKTISIRNVEKTARRDRNDAADYNDMSSRTPSGLETPEFTLVNQYNGYDIRKYEPFSVCTVPTSPPRPDRDRTDQPVSNPQIRGASSFGALAGYLFGKNSESTSMKMTTPVLMTGSGDDRQMSFVMPSTYWNGDTLESAPKPLQDSLVSLQREEGGYRAVSMFGGFASDDDVRMRTMRLREGLERDGEWVVVEGEEDVTIAQYNDPFTPPWKRRNEVSLKVVKI